MEMLSNSTFHGDKNHQIQLRRAVVDFKDLVCRVEIESDVDEISVRETGRLDLAAHMCHIKVWVFIFLFLCYIN